MKNTSSDRWVAYLVSITAAVLVLLFGLQRFGIWQPAEIHVADLARELIAGRTVALDRPPGQVAAVALGFRLGGVSELWGRLPTALLAFASACALMAAARGAGDRRLAAYVGITYATIPLVFMNARQMFGGGVAQSASTLALAGFVLLLWGRTQRWQLGGAGLALIGLLLGVRSAGVMLGVVPILGAVGLAGLLRFGAESRLTRVTSA
ncbi:MAG: Polymyxin resistance protein ArnT, undecaprenyl phosphate-alpha-L-Ara4N transferase, partial [Labilithrix sp.]|nr:Polymyxin resistance protein ArnT, undecaprenyl phosphate-alpha-L-Ara4N transferase [Labilithrix sp.]